MKIFNRDLSWISFNERVLQEAEDTGVPLLERLKFLAIYSSNLEEFFRVRVASIRSLAKLKDKSKLKLGYDPVILLKQIRNGIGIQQERFGNIFRQDLMPELKKNGIVFRTETELTKSEIKILKEFFDESVRPHLQPVLLAGTKLRVFLKSGTLYLAVKLDTKPDSKKSKNKSFAYAMLELPTDRVSRIIQLPSESGLTLVFLDDVVRLFLPEIFPGFRPEEIISVKLTRDAGLDIDDEFSGDLVEKIRKSIAKRVMGAPARFLYDSSVSKNFLKYLVKTLALNDKDLFPGGRYHNFSDLMNLKLSGYDELKFKDPPRAKAPSLNSFDELVSMLRNSGLLYYFPFDTFKPVTDFFRLSAEDPLVKEIKITLYRAAPDSEIMHWLEVALDKGKSVTIFAEVKARFDEESNMRYAEKLKAKGANIIYSLPGLKVHCKLAVVRRSAGKELQDFVYMSTGNFNERTSAFYTDFGYFTSDNAAASDALSVFGFLEGKENSPAFRKLLVAQFNMKQALTGFISEEIEKARKGGSGRIILKLNSIEDETMIKHLYKASNAGVKITLIVRGICCLVPGVKGQSDNINVISIIDRYLEHSRVYIFGEGDDSRIYLSSADWMKRNLDRRIETAFPLTDMSHRKMITDILEFQMNDLRKGRIIDKKQRNRFRGAEQSETSAQEKIHEYVRMLRSDKDQPFSETL